MFKKIDRIRQEDEKKRKRLALFIALIITLVIFFLWFSLKIVYFKTETDASEESRDVRSPIESFLESFEEGASQIKRNINDLREVL